MTTLRRHLPLLGFGLAVTIIYPVAVFVAGTVPLVETRRGASLLVRRNRWITVAPVFLLNLLAASFVVPTDHQGLLHALKYLAAPAELLLLGYLGLTVARTARRFQTRCPGAPAPEPSRRAARALGHRHAGL